MRKIYFLLLTVFIAAISKAQVSVTATAGTTGPTVYANLSSAFTAINAGTHQGAITVDITANFTDVAVSVLNSSGAGAASYTSVLVRPTVDGVTMSFATTTGRGVIELNGADNVTIDGDNPNSGGTNRNLTITNTAASTITYTSVIRLASSTLVTSNDNNVIKNCILNGSAAGRNASGNTSTTGSESTTYGILVGAGASTTVATNAPSAITSVATTMASGQTASNFMADNNSIDAAARGISINGSVVGNVNTFTISNNVIGAAAPSTATTVYLQGISVQGFTAGLIRGNTIRNMETFVGSSTNNVQLVGIALGSVSANGTGLIVEQNNISRVFNRNTGTFAATGIFVNLSSTSNTTIRNNFISEITHDMTGGSAFSFSFNVSGIKIMAGTHYSILHNSVNLFGTLTGTASSSHSSTAFGVGATSQTNVDVRNNIFSNTITGGTTSVAHVAVILPSGGTSAMNYTQNNNAYYVGSGANQFLAHTGTSFTTTYTAANFVQGAIIPATNWRSYTSTLNAGGTNDNASYASITAAPFTSPTNLHIPNATVSVLESSGANVGVTNDIDGDTRPNGTAPDIGADEFTGVFLDIVAPAITFTPPAPVCGVGDIAVNGVTIVDASGVPTAGALMPRIYFRKNGGSYVSSAGTLASGTATNGTWNFTISAAALGGLVNGDLVSYYIIAQDIATTPNISSNPAGVVATDVNTVTTHPTVNYNISSGALSGTYTVGVGGNFTTLTAAVAAYNTSCLAGPVLFSLTDATYPGETFPITINANATASSTNTLTIRPTGTTTISGSSTAAILIINDGDYITIDGSSAAGTATGIGGNASLRNLTIQNTSTSTSSGVIQLASSVGGATNNQIRNLNVFGNDPTQTLIGIAVGGQTLGTAGTDNDNNRIENCNVQKTLLGIYDAGASIANPNTGTVIRRNDLSATGANRIRRGAILIFNENGIDVSENRIGGISSDEGIDVYGIGAGVQAYSTTTTTSGGITNATISRNIINGVASTSTTGFSAVGIGIAGDVGANTISNNMVSGVTAPSTSPDLVAGIFVVGVTGSDTRLYYNTVSLSGDRGAVASQIGSYGIAITGTNPTVDLRDNIFHTTQTSGGGANAKSYALGMVTTTFTNLTSNYNNFYFSGANAGGFRTGGLGATATDYATLAAWQAATTKDANSLNVNPVFVSATDLHLVPASNSGLNNLGQPIAGITTDIDFNTRSINVAPQGPDMGADEFIGTCTGALGGTASGGTTFCGSGTPIITASGYSEGTDAGYQWQSSTDNFVTNIVDIPGQTNPASLTTGVVSVTTYYRLRVTCPTGTALDYSNTVLVEVNNSPIITSDPASTAVCSGATASFTVTLGNPGPFTYQWQENTGSGFNNIPGATNSSLAFTPTPAQNGYQYRVIVTNTCGNTTSNAATLTVSANPLANIAYGQTLFGSDNAGNLYRINTTTGAGTLVGNIDGTTIGTTEIEFNHANGKAYAQGSANSYGAYEFNILTGAYIGPVVGNASTYAALEYVGNNLYGASFVAPLSASTLSILNPTTGVATPVGLTGINQVAGLAYDLTSGIMYGIAGGGGPAGLYTINLTTGAATLIGSTGIQAGSLEFGPDGRLYAGGTGGTNGGNIYVINTTTGAATLLGNIGNTNGVTGLTLANVPAVFCSNQGTVPVILTGSTGGTYSSSPAGLTIDPSTGAINTNTSTAGTYTVTYTIPAVGVCPQVITNAPVTINSAPVVAPITGPSTVCTGQTITLSSTTPGGTWTSTNTAAATVDPVTGVVTGVAAGSTTINYSVTAGCTTTVSAGVSVLAGPPTPVITPAAPVICAGTVQPLSISGGATTVTFTGTGLTLPAGAPGTTSGNASPYPATIAVSGLPTSGVTVKSVTINGLTHTFPGDLDILLQSPTTTNVVLMSDIGGGADVVGVNYTFDDAAAANLSATLLNPTGSYKPTNSGTPDTWPAPGPGSFTQATPTLSTFTGNFNGTWNLLAVDDAGGDVGSITSWSITFDVSPIIWSPITGLFTNAAGTIPYTGTSASTVYASPAATTTYTATNSSGGCSASANVTVTVNPVPNVNAVANQALCHGSTTTAVSFTGTVPGTVYNWTNSAPSIGLAASGTGDIAAFTATNTGATPVVATITVTPTYTNAGTTCTGTARTFTITVNPILAITTQPSNRVICSGVNTTFSVAVSGAPTYQWQINQGSGFVNVTNTPPFSGATTNTLILTNPTTTLNGATFQVVITSPCGNATSSPASLTVNPLPTIAVGPNGLCAPVTLTATGNSNTYSWAPATGLSATTGATVTATPTGNTTYTVTGTITATGCQNSASVNVLGTPPPVVVTPANPSICAGQIQQLSVPSGTATFNNSGTITIPFGSPSTTSGPALPYPSAISVAGLPATGVTVRSVTINGITHTFPADIDIVLQSPTGTNVILMSDVGGTAAITGTNYTFDDAAAAAIGTVTTPSGTYRPSNSGTPDTWVAPGPGALTQATPTLSSFTGNPNGNWGLYIVDDAGGDIGSISSWSITFNIPTATWSPITGLFTDPAGTIPYTAGTFLNTVYASPTATTTYTVTGALGTCTVPNGTVTVTVNPRPTITVTPNNQCGPVTLTAAGTSNTYSWSPAFGLSATTGATVTATPDVNTVYTVTGTITATGCTNTATVTVNARPPAPTVTPTAITICQGAVTQLTAASGDGTATINSGTIAVAIPDNTPAGANHVLALTGVPAGATITNVSVNFNITHTFDGDLIINLRAPNGNVLNLVNRRGGAGDNFTNTTISSTGSSPVSGGSAPFTGTFTADAANAVGPTGFVSNVAAFSNLLAAPNGNWTLAINDNAGIDIGTLTSWSISISYTLPNAIWTPITGLFTDPAATIPYVANTPLNVVYAKPTATTTYSVTRATASCPSNATTVTVTVVTPITITTQPANITTCTGANATFSVVATGNFLNYQWQLSTNGGTTWNNIAGATNASLTLTGVTTAMNNNRYRVIISNSCNTVTSNGAILNVSDPTPPTVTALNNRICISDTLVPLVGLPVGGSWSGIGVSGNNFVPTATAVGTYTLTYTYRNAANCVSTATVVAKVEDCPERMVRLIDDGAVVLYPNPNNGRFNIRVQTTLYNYLAMRVYNAQGQLLKIQTFGGLVYGRVIPVDLSHLPSGIYMVKLYHDSGTRSSDKTFKVVIAR